MQIIELANDFIERLACLLRGGEVTEGVATPVVASSDADLEREPQRRASGAAGEEERDVELYARTPFTAWEHALGRGCHHPILWERVKGSPFERLYRERFNPPEELAPATAAPHRNYAL